MRDTWSRNVWPGGLGIPAGSLVEINGSDTTAGFNVSLLYTPYHNSEGKPLVNFGMVYRSQATFHLTGNFLVNGTSIANTAATFVLPQVFSGGIAVWPVRTQDREWKLEFDVDYVGWKSTGPSISIYPTAPCFPFHKIGKAAIRRWSEPNIGGFTCGHVGAALRAAQR